jgi:hypothetical protein
VGSYIRFTQQLLGVKIRDVGMSTASLAVEPTPRQEDGEDVRYDVVTLNYDMILERCAEAIRQLGAKELRFNTVTTESPVAHLPWLVKLHGSADDQTSIIPPTWRKTLDERVEKQWRKAFELVRDANYIRVIGYSLPDSDAYVRFLLKSAVAESKHLKRFDVLSIDHSASPVYQRYAEFVAFKYARYKATHTSSYLNHVSASPAAENPNAGERQRIFVNTSFSHESFMPDATRLTWRFPERGSRDFDRGE